MSPDNWFSFSVLTCKQLQPWVPQTAHILAGSLLLAAGNPSVCSLLYGLLYLTLETTLSCAHQSLMVVVSMQILYYCVLGDFHQVILLIYDLLTHFSHCLIKMKTKHRDEIC